MCSNEQLFRQACKLLFQGFSHRSFPTKITAAGVTSCLPLATGTRIGAGRLVSPVKPFCREFRLAIYHPALRRVATRQRKNLVLLLEAHLAFPKRYPRGQGKESNSPKETDPWIGFIRTDGKPSTI
jgi:hypothetical protein